MGSYMINTVCYIVNTYGSERFSVLREIDSLEVFSRVSVPSPAIIAMCNMIYA